MGIIMKVLGLMAAVAAVSIRQLSIEAPKKNSSSSFMMEAPKANSTSSFMDEDPKANSTSSFGEEAPKANSTSSFSEEAPKKNSTSSFSTETPKKNSTSSFVQMSGEPAPENDFRTYGAVEKQLKGVAEQSYKSLDAMASHTGYDMYSEGYNNEDRVPKDVQELHTKYN